MPNDTPTFVRIPWPATYVAACGEEPPEGKGELYVKMEKAPDIARVQELERERDRYLRALQELAWDPIITVAEHVGEAPWLGDILAEAERKPTPQR